MLYIPGTNVDALQDAIITLSELLETRADYSGLVEGSIIESQTDIGRGKIATMLVQRGEQVICARIDRLLKYTGYNYFHCIESTIQLILHVISAIKRFPSYVFSLPKIIIFYILAY